MHPGGGKRTGTDRRPSMVANNSGFTPPTQLKRQSAAAGETKSSAPDVGASPVAVYYALQ